MEKLIGQEREWSRKIHSAMRHTGKCCCCQTKETFLNNIIMWNIEQTAQMCPNCSKLYVNKDFVKLIERIAYRDSHIVQIANNKGDLE